MNTPTLVLSSSLVAAAVVWYLICDRVASTSTHYALPTDCCRCDAHPGSTRRTTSRRWFFVDNDVIDLFFPYSERTAEVPICQSCLGKVEASEKLTHKLALGVAALSFISLSYALRVSVVWPSIASSVCSFVTFGILGIILSAWVFLIAKSVLSLFPGLAPPARFTILGRLRFRNRPYQQKFSSLNSNPEAQIPQHQIPIGLMVGIALALALSVLSDIMDIAGALLSKSSLAAHIVDIVFVLGKIASILLVFRFRMISVILWGIILIADISLNPNFSIDGEIEDILLAGVLLTIFVYKWWQTRRRSSTSGQKPA